MNLDLRVLCPWVYLATHTNLTECVCVCVYTSVCMLLCACQAFGLNLLGLYEHYL